MEIKRGGNVDQKWQQHLDDTRNAYRVTCKALRTLAKPERMYGEHKAAQWLVNFNSKHYPVGANAARRSLEVK